MLNTPSRSQSTTRILRISQIFRRICLNVPDTVANLQIMPVGISSLASEYIQMRRQHCFVRAELFARRFMLGNRSPSGNLP